MQVNAAKDLLYVGLHVLHLLKRNCIDVVFPAFEAV